MDEAAPMPPAWGEQHPLVSLTGLPTTSDRGHIEGNPCTNAACPIITLAVVAVVALVLGSFGTATATGLTTKQVKKIAAKVVKKKAKTLSVKDAKTLKGKPASAYETKTYVYTLPATTPSNEQDYTFPGLPRGTYLVNYNAFFDNSDGEPVGCQLVRDTNFTEYFAVAYGAPSLFSEYTSAVGSAVLTTSPVSPPVLDCWSQVSGNFSINDTASVASQVTFTRVDSASVAESTQLVRPARPIKGGSR